MCAGHGATSRRRSWRACSTAISGPPGRVLIRPRRAIAHGVSKLISSVETGKLADLVLWKPTRCAPADVLPTAQRYFLF